MMVQALPVIAAPANAESFVGGLVAIPGKPWKMMKNDVTFDQWNMCYKEGGCKDYLPPDDEGWGTGNRPVINVSYNDVLIYIEWLNKKTERRFRLPTEEEWEYAARGGTTTNYWWGDSISCSKARYGMREGGECGGEAEGTVPVAKYPANAYGLHDMAGNVWQWISSCWEGDCSQRVVRGGSYYDEPELLMVTYRTCNPADMRNLGNGFRLVVD